MNPVADANGNVAGKFTIPSGVRTGTKLVKCMGGYGSVAKALYTGTGQVIEATLQREVTEIYQPPPAPRPVIVISSSYSTRKGVAINIPAASGMLKGCSTPNGGALTMTEVTQPAGGAVVAKADGSFTYTPGASFLGLDTFTFVAGDGAGESGIACVFVSVLDTQLPPVARDDNWSTLMNVAVVKNVIANDSSPDGRPVHLISNTNPAHGAVVTTSAGAITYTPTTGYTGVDSFTYTIADDRGLVATATVWVHVEVPPIKAVDDEVNLNRLWGSSPGHARLTGWGGNLTNTDVSIAVLANDNVVAGTVVVAVTQPVQAGSIYTPWVSINAGGTGVTFHVNTGASASVGYRFSIDSTFTYTIQSPSGARSTARVRVYASNIYVDPLAQTFALGASAQLFGVDVWVAKKGVGPLAIELRNVAYGIPVQQPLVRGEVALADIVEGGWNRVWFPVPATVLADANYAFVAMCDDSVTELAVAEIGKFDLDAKVWVTAQPYSIGVMLTSSNNATWTPHQNSDLAFRLITKSFEVMSRRVALGTVALVGDTDFLVAANVDIPAPGCAVDFELAMPDGAVYTVSAHQPLALSSAQTGNMTVTAVLTGTDTFTPTLYPDVTVLHGPIGATGSYVSRAMPAGPGSRVRIIYEAKLPAGSSVAATLRKAVNGVPGYTEAAIPVIATAALDDGMVEYTHELTGVDADTVQVALVESGSAAARPDLRNFRAMVM